VGFSNNVSEKTAAYIFRDDEWDLQEMGATSSSKFLVPIYCARSFIICQYNNHGSNYS
jgi:hypothetical protein